MIHIFVHHPIPSTTQHVSAVLEGEPDFVIMGHSDSFDTTVAHLSRSPCDILLLSYTFTKDWVRQLMESVSNLPLPCKVMLIDLPNEEEAILDCLEEGIDGYVCTGEGMAELVKKIRYLAEDEFIVAPHIGALLIARISQLKQLVNELDGGNMTRTNENYAELTQREWEVLRLLGQDCSNQQIAAQLTIELGTVKNHVHNLLRKLDVCNRKQAAQLSLQLFAQSAPNDKPSNTWPTNDPERSNEPVAMASSWQISAPVG